MATHSSVLAWRIPGTAGPGGRGFSRVAAAFSSYDGDLSLPLWLALGSPIFPSGCEGTPRLKKASFLGTVQVWPGLRGQTQAQWWPACHGPETQPRELLWPKRGWWGGRGNASELTAEGRRKGPEGQSLGKGGRQREWTEPEG